MTTLPQLERELVIAAHRRGAARRRLRRVAAVLVGATLAVGGAATAATTLLRVDEGTTARGPYVIERLPDRGGMVCLQYRDETGRRPTYGCGARPSDTRPIGLVVADSNAVPGRRVMYGLVADGVARVSVLGRGDDHVDATARAQPGIPGRYFLATVPRTPGVELVAYDGGGRELGRLGSRATFARSPRSRDEAIAQGDPSGFAPATAALSQFSYRGGSIEPGAAAHRGLACAEDEIGVRCYDTEAEMEAAERAP